ncbi:MAG: dipeptidyl aminopeptidase/acylaminoacyl peptidase [Bradymonadia bacterium]|jgi:dipeptidyl aminopeptidase/acylaminoacyl peptidase
MREYRRRSLSLRHTCSAGVLVFAAAACGGSQSADTPAPPQQEEQASSETNSSDYSVSFRDRSIDLEPYVQGFPFRRFSVDIESQQMLYFETTEERMQMRRLGLGEETLDLASGEAVGDADWSERSWWGADYHPQSERWIAWADDANEERMNLFWLDANTGATDRLTDNDYTYGFGVSEDGEWLAYVNRRGQGEPFNSCLHVRNLSSGDDREVLCDDGGVDRFTWTSVPFSPDGSSVLVTLQHDGDRATENVARVNLRAENPALEMLFERGVRHTSLWFDGDTYDGRSVVAVSSQNGFSNLYRLATDGSGATPITEYSEDVGSLWPLDDDRLLIAIERPWETSLRVLSAGGDVLHEEIRPTSVSLLDADGTSAVFVESSVGTPFWMGRLEIGDSLLVTEAATMPADVRTAIVQCQAERVQIPTFDMGPDGTPRMLHAWYLSPTEPSDDPLVRITAFYGGDNYFSTSAHLMCEAGVATLSPAVRGSSGYGADFFALNDGDLGGDEIVDLFYVARWLEAEKGYGPEQIGVHGGSHGGYATMRALTFPPETNDRNETFPFGFGLSHAGFSNILTFYESCNIPDWVVLEAGDPTTEAEKLLDRSPISHVDLLQSPILLTHGSNDSRVPVEESRTFASAAEELGRPVTYVEFEGQGHGISGLENTMRYYRAVFAFLETL